MKRFCVLAVLMMVCGGELVAQKETAKDHAYSWFGRGGMRARAADPGLNGAIDLWGAALPKATGAAADRFELLTIISTFNPVWNDGNKLLPERVALFAKRLEQIPPAAVKEWTGMTEADSIRAAATLAAEETLFTPAGAWDAKGYAALIAQFKAS